MHCRLLNRVRDRGRVAIISTLLFIAIGCSGGDGKPDDSAIAARLNGITIEGAGSALNPEFSPDIFRYSLVADAESNSISVLPFADESMLISINGQPVNSGDSTPINDLQAGDTIKVEVDTSDSVQGVGASYEILYLPSDFPKLTVSSSEDGASDDLLYVTLATRAIDSFYVANLDNNAVPTFYKKVDTFIGNYKLHEATNERTYSRRLESVNEWGRANGETVLFDANFDEVETFTTVGLSHTDFHDFLILPDNQLVLLSYDGTLKDLSEFGLSSAELVEESVIQIVDRTTRVPLFEWRSLDEIPFDNQLYDPIQGEYAHINSVFVDFDGNLIASLRGTSNIIKIDRSSGRILWTMGGKANEFTFISDPFTGTCGQHAATRLANGNILVFDNGQQCLPSDNRGKQSRVVEYKIDEANRTAELVWSYQEDDEYSVSQGSAQRLSNGNTLISWGRRQVHTMPSALITEVDKDGNVLFEISATSETRVDVYRAYRFSE